MSALDIITNTVQEHYPDVQGVYLFGSFGTANEWPDSDVDIALLFKPEDAKRERLLAMGGCSSALVGLLHKEVDLLNARLVSTVFQKEIVMHGRLIYCGDRSAVDEFEMLTLSKYQKLNEERQDIVAAALSEGSFYAV